MWKIYERDELLRIIDRERDMILPVQTDRYSISTFNLAFVPTHREVSQDRLDCSTIVGNAATIEDSSDWLDYPGEE